MFLKEQMPLAQKILKVFGKGFGEKPFFRKVLPDKKYKFPNSRRTNTGGAYGFLVLKIAPTTDGPAFIEITAPIWKNSTGG